MGGIKIRSAEIRDADQIAKLCCKGFWDDELIAEIMHPHRHQFPEDFADYFRRKFLKAMENASHQAIVAISSGTNGDERVVGWADYIRQTPDDESTAQATVIGSDTAQNRAADPSKLDILDRAGEFTKHYWSGSRANTYFLDMLCVDPAHHGKGIGKMLVMEGIRMARQDRVCASVVSSLAGHRLYLSCGFKDVGWVTEGAENPLRHLPSGQIMFWEGESA